ncbi:hypothetical protein HYDPIDRAFT_96423, partial [Hydnomerulius pinastri MD-312]
LPEGWTAHKHPEGALYYMHGATRTFAEVNICDEDIFEDIEYYRDFLIKELSELIEMRNLSESLDINEVQLVLEPQADDFGIVCHYYFVNPRSRTLFWTDEWDGECIFTDCRGILSAPHKGLAIQSHYWKHWDLFPNLCKVTEELKGEVTDMILHATCDHLTSNRSSCPLNADELKNYLSLVEKIDSGFRIYSDYPLGRIMHTFYHSYFINFHGEVCARLNFDQTVHGWRYQPSMLMAACAPVLFMAPVTNVRALHKIFVDDVASKEKWNTFVNKLNSQLQDTNLLATVLLNANVGFLAIQSVDDGNGTALRQIASYMSLVASFASIVLGLVFVGHNRTETRNTAFQAAVFLSRLHHKKHGLETLAIIYSLPYAFLMWGMVLFFAAFSAEWCGPGDVASWVSVGAFMFGICILVAWCIWTSRERTPFWWFEPDPAQVSLEDFPEEGDDGASFLSKKGFLSRFIGFPSLQKSRGSGFDLESHSMEQIQPEPTSPHVEPPDSTQDEDADSEASSPVAIAIRRPTMSTAPSSPDE